MQLDIIIILLLINMQDWLLTRSMRTSYESETVLTGLDSDGSHPRFSHIDRTLDMWVSRKFTSRSWRYFSFDPQMYSNNWKKPQVDKRCDSKILQW